MPPSLNSRIVNRLLGPHPAVFAFLLGGGAFLVLFFGYTLFFPDSSAERADFNQDISVVWRWVLVVIGALMWLAGGIKFGRSYGVRWFVSLPLHLLPGIGLILIRALGKPITAHDAWARENPGFDEKTAKRTYRPMKPLY